MHVCLHACLFACVCARSELNLLAFFLKLPLFLSFLSFPSPPHFNIMIIVMIIIFFFTAGHQHGPGQPICKQGEEAAQEHEV